MIDQLRIGNKYSYDDYEASMKERSISMPPKKTIKDTVPYTNKTYDFTNLDGEAYWEERKLEYTFEILADSPEELEEKKRLFLAWIMFIHEEELFDPYISDYHFTATYDDIDIDDSEIEKSTIKVVFSAYPFMLANKETVYTFTAEAKEERTLQVVNTSSHRVIPKFTATQPFSIGIGGTFNYAVPEGTTIDELFELEVGVTTLNITNNGTKTGTLTITFREEVM